MAKQVRIYSVLLTDSQGNIKTAALVAGQSLKQVADYYGTQNFSYIDWAEIQRVTYGSDKKSFGFVISADLVDGSDELIAKKDTVFFHPKEKLTANKDCAELLTLQEKSWQFLNQYYVDDMPEVGKMLSEKEAAPAELLEGVMAASKPLIYNARISLLNSQFEKLKQDFAEIKFAVTLLAKSWLKGDK